MKRLLLTMLVLVGFVAMDASAKEKPAEKTRTADTDKDGKVSKEEFLALAKKNAEKKGIEYNQKRAENIFAKKDTNKDGFLTADDVVKKTAPKKEKGAGTAEQ
ncbi:EF-hand domain-containing protein [Pontiella sulfatireligans]|uniref:EF-hand domain-containing protein n=1 Tax=Pontiella sulfatireligans TaxID=2750658 RepID=A0A6C2UKN6_9BACT|nr:EF-hand domain-containing protein [Pontiella sulfatireligans]VGO19746.1 hypothetical protein SCARR_01805 [Pontiella sulfatireligans]